MPNRRFLVMAGATLVLGAAGGLLLSRPDPHETGAIRILPPDTPAPVPTSSTPQEALLPSPTPSPTAEPGIDPPPPPQEAGSPDYAKLGVQPAI